MCGFISIRYWVYHVLLGKVGGLISDLVSCWVWFVRYDYVFSISFNQDVGSMCNTDKLQIYYLVWLT